MTGTPKPAAGAWFVLGAAMLWGTTGTAQSFAPADFDPLVIGACRLAIGGVALLLLALCRRELGCWRDWPRRGVLLAALFTAVYQLSFFAAVARTGVAVGTIVGIGSSPIAAGILAYLVRGERPGRRWALATGVALLGCTLLVFAGRGEAVRIEFFGLFLAILAGAAYAAYTLSIKQLLETHSPNAVMAVVVCVAAALLAPVFWLRPTAWLAQPQSLAVVLHLGLFTMALSYWLFARGLLRVPVATAVTLSLAEPMTAGLLGVLVVGERLTLPAWCGLLLILCGLLVLTVPRRRLSAAGGGVKNQGRAYACALATVLLWSTVASAFKLSLRHLRPIELLFYACLTSCLVLLAVLAAQRKLPLLRRLAAADWRRSAKLGLLNPALYYLVLFQAYDLLPAQQAQALNYTWAITLSLLAIPLLGQKISRRELLAVAVSYLGVLVIATRGDLLALHFDSLPGVALALFSTVLWALYWIFTTRDRRDPVLALLLNFVCALPPILLVLLLTSGLRLPPVAGLAGAVYVGVFEMGISFVLWLQAMKLADNTARIANLIFLSPFLSLVFIRLLVGERDSSRHRRRPRPDRRRPAARPVPALDAATADRRWKLLNRPAL